MQINTLKRKNKNKKSAAVGRGGKRGKTSGKGTKGQNARSGRKKRPEIRDTIKRFPKLRGRGISPLKSIQAKFQSINIGALESVFSSGDSVSPETLVLKGLLTKSAGALPKVKILGGGELTKKLSVSSCSVSLSAKQKIESAGGSVV